MWIFLHLVLIFLYKDIAHHVGFLLVGTEHDGLCHSTYATEHLRYAVCHYFLPPCYAYFASVLVASVKFVKWQSINILFIGSGVVALKVDVKE